MGICVTWVGARADGSTRSRKRPGSPNDSAAKRLGRARSRAEDGAAPPPARSVRHPAATPPIRDFLSVFKWFPAAIRPSPEAAGARLWTKGGESPQLAGEDAILAA